MTTICNILSRISLKQLMKKLEIQDFFWCAIKQKTIYKIVNYVTLIFLSFLCNCCDIKKHKLSVSVHNE